MYNKILAPLDGSKFSECSLEQVKQIASGHQDVKVILLTVLKPMIVPGEMWYTSRSQIEELSATVQKEEKQMQDNAQIYLSGISDSLKKAGIETEIVIIKNKDTYEIAEAILDYAENNNIDLIVMSTHGRSGPARWAFGSITDRVVRHSKLPVLTVAPAGCRI